MEFVDRIEELARLRHAADEAPHLVIVSGRRRVGKSALCDAAYAGRRLLYFQADQQDEGGHLALLAREAAEIVPGRPPLAFSDWDTALTFVADQAAVAPLVVVLDEFQWLWDAQPALDSLIQRHWDRWRRSGVPVTLVLTGSSLTHMDRLLMPERPLYGRADYRPVIEPLDYRWSARLAGRGDDAPALLRRYAVLGGTPQYQLWAGRGRLAEVIAGRILAKGESLYEEPLSLLAAEGTIRTPAGYFVLMRALAAGATRHNEIARQAGIETAALSRMLDRLIALGYVELRAPLEHDGFAARRGVYRIRDPFFRFWFRYVFPNRSRLERGRIRQVADAVSADLDDYMGLAFEDACREWLGRYADEMPPTEEIGSWWDRTGRTEIDLVATARRRYTVVGSCKWSRSAGLDVLAALDRGIESLGARAGAAERVIFARGFSADLVRRAEREGVRLVPSADLFG